MLLAAVRAHGPVGICAIARPTAFAVRGSHLLAATVASGRLEALRVRAPHVVVLRAAASTSPILCDRSPHARGFAAQAHKSEEDDATKPLTAMQKLQKWMYPFLSGSRALYYENKRAWEIRQRLRAHAYAEAKGEPSQPPVLTRQEMMLLRQAHRDLLKSLPLVSLFMVPILGYVAPVLGYQFPKQLLPWQFWRPSQKTQFFREDAQARAKHYPRLIALLLQVDRKHKCVQEILRLHGASEGLDPAQVMELSTFFDADANGPAALPVLSRRHVCVLAQSIATMPAFAWFIAFLPPQMLRKRLEKRMEELRVDDAMLLREGIDGLSLSELEFACEERGIVDGYGDIEALRTELREWLAMYADETAPTKCPSSLLLHAPALMNPTGNTEKSEK